MLNIVYYIKLQCSVNCSAFWFDYTFWRLFQVDQHSKLSCTNYHLHCKQLDCFDLLVGWNTQACDKMHVSKARNKHSGLNDMSRSSMYRMCAISRVQWEVRYGLQVHTTQTHKHTCWVSARTMMTSPSSNWSRPSSDAAWLSSATPWCKTKLFYSTLPHGCDV